MWIVVLHHRERNDLQLVSGFADEKDALNWGHQFCLRWPKYLMHVCFAFTVMQKPQSTPLTET